MSVYNWLTPKEHMITVRNRETGFAKQYRYWDDKIIEKVLSRQLPVEDVYITKYPKGRLVETIILDFDSSDLDEAYHDVKRMRNYLRLNDHNCVIVRSGSKGYHLYIQIAPFLFRDTDIRVLGDWRSYFNAFVCFLIHDGDYTYETLDKVNFTAGLNGNIRLIGSKHPKTGNVCEIIEGEFISNQIITDIQDNAQRMACEKLRIVSAEHERIISSTRIEHSNDPVSDNDLRTIFPKIVNIEGKIYPKGYMYINCPFHSDENPSMLVTKEWYSCSGCGEKGNIWTLMKKGLVNKEDYL